MRRAKEKETWKTTRTADDHQQSERTGVPTVDAVLNDKNHQAEFDRRVPKARETAKEKGRRHRAGVRVLRLPPHGGTGLSFDVERNKARIIMKSGHRKMRKAPQFL